MQVVRVVWLYLASTQLTQQAKVWLTGIPSSFIFLIVFSAAVDRITREGVDLHVVRNNKPYILFIDHDTNGKLRECL